MAYTQNNSAFLQELLWLYQLVTDLSVKSALNNEIQTGFPGHRTTGQVVADHKWTLIVTYSELISVKFSQSADRYQMYQGNTIVTFMRTFPRSAWQ